MKIDYSDVPDRGVIERIVEFAFADQLRWDIPEPCAIKVAVVGRPPGRKNSPVPNTPGAVPTADEMASMVRLISQAMDEGAWGLSTGLVYAPSFYATTEELVELSQVPAGRGGFYFSHIRGEDRTLLQAIAEAIEIGERCGVPVQIAHLKAYEPETWPLLDRALALLDDARARGVDIAADRYPYTAS